MNAMLLLSLLLNASLTIVCIYIYRELRLDGPTTLLNKSQFDIDKKRMRREGDVILVIDIDKFKVINDTRGHAYGDTVIKDVADAIIRNIRRSDRAYRIGGDEFAIISDNTQGLKERIQSSLRVSVSVGIGKTYEEADGNMYKNKAK